MASYDYSITSLQSHLSMLRKLYGWTMEQFGDRIGVTKQTVSNLERGKPKMTKLQYIAIRSVFESEVRPSAASVTTYLRSSPTRQ